MGLPMALQLVRAGYRVVGMDSDSNAVTTFYDSASALSVPSATDDHLGLFDVVITMLPTSAVVRTVLLDAGPPLLSRIRSGGLVIDMSSSAASETIDLGRELAKHDIALVDAPVSGGTAAAAQGTLAIMIGARDDASFKRAQPLLAALGNRLLRAGPIGAGHAAKAINNAVAATVISATSEGLVLAEKCGIERSDMLEIINASTGQSLCSKALFPSQIMSGKFAQGFAIELMAKDVGLAARLVEESGSVAPMLELAAAQWAQAAKAKPGADFTEMQLFVEERASE